MQGTQQTNFPAAEPPFVSAKLPRRFFLIAALLGAGLIAAVLFSFNPAQHSFYPSCPLHRLTGLSCPGCGGLRALHQLSHGNFATAFQLNPLLVALLPVLGWFGLREVVRQTTGKKLLSLFARAPWGWVLLGITIVFTVVRNLPWPVFAWMAAP
jgi:hypothetical protein